MSKIARWQRPKKRALVWLSIFGNQARAFLKLKRKNMIEQQRKKYRDLGVTEGPGRGRIIQHAFRTVMSCMEVIKDGSGEFVYPVVLSHGQNRDLLFRLNSHHGLRHRLMTIRGISFGEGKQGTLMLIAEANKRRSPR